MPMLPPNETPLPGIQTEHRGTAFQAPSPMTAAAALPRPWTVPIPSPSRCDSQPLRRDGPISEAYNTCETGLASLSLRASGFGPYPTPTTFSAPSQNGPPSFIPLPAVQSSLPASISSSNPRPGSPIRNVRRSSGLPDLGLTIPNLPLKHNGKRNESTALADILFLWENAAPEHGLDVPLCQWKLEPTDANHRAFAMKLQLRKMIALEYIEL